VPANGIAGVRREDRDVCDSTAESASRAGAAHDRSAAESAMSGGSATRTQFAPAPSSSAATRFEGTPRAGIPMCAAQAMATPASANVRIDGAGDGCGGNVPPNENHKLFTGGRPLVSRSALTGCSCSSIWISLCQRRHFGASGPAGSRTRSGSPRLAAGGRVVRRGATAARAKIASGRAATNARPSSTKCALSVATIAAACAAVRSSTIADNAASSRPTTSVAGSAASQ
jgi:hypothetical protein